MEKNKSAYWFRLNDLLILSFKMKNYFKNIFLKDETKEVGEVGTDGKFGTLNISSLESVHEIENSMNDEIVPNEETNSQSVKTENEKKKSKKDENGRLASVEQNVERFAKFGLFCTSGASDARVETSREFNLGKDVLKDGSTIERRITVVPSAKYGYPTVGALEVLEGIQYLQSQNPKSDIVTIPSVKFFITKILKRAYNNKNRDLFLLHLATLFNTSFALEHCFYSKDREEYEEELTNFHLLEELNLRKRKTRDVTREASSVRLNKYVFENIKLNYTKPFYIDTAFKIRSEIGKLLYRMLCFHFTHHDKFNYSTKRIFEELNIKSKAYDYPSDRKRALTTAMKQVLDLPISLNKVVASYEFQKTVDDRDWNLIILRKQSSKVINSKSKLKTHAEADSQFLEVKLNTNKKKTKPVKTQNTTAQEESSAEIFITLFCAKFPHAKPERNLSEKVKKRANEFVEKHGLENAKDFLVFCAEVGQRQEFSEVLKGQTVNYLFDFKAGDQHLIDAWLNDRGQKKIQEEQETHKVRHKKFDQFENLRQRYREEYQQGYIKPRFNKFDEETSARFGQYTKKSISERVSHFPNKLSQKMMERHCLQSADDFIYRFIGFCRTNLDEEILTLDQWIVEHKTQEESEEYFNARNKFEAIEAESKAVGNL